ncbi:hypothetical protein EKI60_04670 [Candidatus Saccharibacteria bacterium]|nr:MAG: hypothetical protein EKI60_04670 [Candidatus Saccharibacteria bacterium]
MPKPKASFNEDDDFDFIKENKPSKSFSTVSPSGSPIPLMTEAEVTFYEDKRDRYQTDNKFTNVSDLLELDRVLLHEVMCFRWGQWLLTGGLDYDGNPQLKLENMIQLYSKEIRELKAALGVDKKSRDANKGLNTADFFENLKLRAEQFGIHRNEQIIKAYTLWKELEGLYTLHKNSTPTERSEFKCHEADVFEWLEEKFVELDALDEAFRTEQKIWIRTELNN